MGICKADRSRWKRGKWRKARSCTRHDFRCRGCSAAAPIQVSASILKKTMVSQSSAAPIRIPCGSTFIFKKAEPGLAQRCSCKMAEAGTGPASASVLGICVRRCDQLPWWGPLPSGLRYCCLKTMMHPGPVVRPLRVVVLPHSLAPFPVKSPAGSVEFCTPFTGRKAV
jgi:hypothetical protein